MSNETESRKRSKINVNEAIKRAYYNEKEKNEQLRKEVARLNEIIDKIKSVDHLVRNHHLSGMAAMDMLFNAIKTVKADNLTK